MPDVNVARDGARLRIVLDAPKGNALTDAMVGVIRHAIRELPHGTKLVTLESAGPDFCFGSSLEEHVASRMPHVLPRFHALVSEWLRIPAVTAAVVPGRCFGGGFEMALACDIVFAADDATFGLPEIKVGAFPPVGSLLLPLKAGAARASVAALTGEPQPASAWRDAGLVELVVARESLAATVEAWFDATLARHSAAALARAALASRLVVRRTFEQLLPEAERLYLDDLLKTADAAEGIAAFLAKRPPHWTDR